MSVARAVRSGSPAYWLCQGGGWLLLFVLAVTLNAGQAAPVLWRLAGVYLWAACAGLALTHGWRAWLRRSGVLGAPRRQSWLRIAPRLLLLAVLMSLLTALGFQVFQPFGPLRDWAWLPSAVLSWLIVLNLWSLLYASATTRRQARQLADDALRLKAEAQHAQLRALQAKVNPHFFFDSLNSLRGLVFENQEAAARMIDQIATLMRYSLGSSEQHTVRLADELVAVRAYLAIEQIRFEERLRVNIDIPAHLEDLPIPPMTLQTLVENAVKYGVEPNPLGSEVRIRASRRGALVELSVANRGAISEHSGSTRIGIDSIKARLTLAWQGRSQLTLSEADRPGPPGRRPAARARQCAPGHWWRRQAVHPRWRSLLVRGAGRHHPVRIGRQLHPGSVRRPAPTDAALPVPAGAAA